MADKTPRTDAAQKEYEDALALHGYDIKAVWLRFRETERELSDARAEAERLREALETILWRPLGESARIARAALAATRKEDSDG